MVELLLLSLVLNLPCEVNYLVSKLLSLNLQLVHLLSQSALCILCSLQLLILDLLVTCPLRNLVYQLLNLPLFVTHKYVVRLRILQLVLPQYIYYILIKLSYVLAQFVFTFCYKLSQILRCYCSKLLNVRIAIRVESLRQMISILIS